MPGLSALSHVGMKKEVTPGTYIAPSAIYIPTDGQPSPQDLYERIVDESYDANSSKVRGVFDGQRDGQIGWNGHLYPDFLGALLVALGLEDTVSGAGPYVHTHKALASGAQPSSWSITDYNTLEARGFPGQKLESLVLKVDLNGTVKYTTLFKGYASAIQSTPTPSFPTAAPWLAWEAQLALGGVASTKMLSAELTISRGTVEQIHTKQNTQDPYAVFAGPLEANWKYRALFESDADLNLYLNNTQAAVALTLTAPSSGPSVVLTSTKTGFTKGTVDRSGTYSVVDLECTGIYSATDAGPVAAVLTNSVAAAS